MGPREPIQPDERVTGITLSPLAKVLIIALGGVAIGFGLGMAVSKILDEARSDAPHVPTFDREVKLVADEVEETEPESITPSIVEVAKELGIDLETRPGDQ